MDARKTGLFIKKKRKELGLSQQNLAAIIYVEPQTISKWERGLGMPDYDNIDRLREIFHCSLEDILEPKIDDTLAVIVSDQEQQDEEITNFPMVISVLDNDEQAETNSDKGEKEKKKSKFSKIFGFFSKKKIKDKISSAFGYQYEEVYNERFLFKNIFKKRTKDDYETTLTQGMYKDSEHHQMLGIEAPWLYARVFIFLLVCALLGFAASVLNDTPIHAVIFGGLVSIIPLVIFLYESNFSRDISLFKLLEIFMLGGAMSLVFALILFGVAPQNEVVLTVVAAPIVEEIAKFTVAVIFISKLKPKNMLSGLLIGFTVGAGFDLFENYQYGIDVYIVSLFENLDLDVSLIDSLANIGMRTFNSFFSGHHYYTGIACAIYVLFKEHTSFKAKELFNLPTMLALLFAMALHATWNGSTYIPNEWGAFALQILVDVICVVGLVMLINLGIAQTKVLAIYSDKCAKDGMENKKETFEGECEIN